MTLTCKWVHDQAGALVMKWTGHHGPAMREQSRTILHERRQIP